TTVIIFLVFYLVVWLSGSSIKEWRDAGWLLKVQTYEKVKPLFIYRTLNIHKIEWRLIPSMIPTLLGAGIFAVLHVPINVPSFSRTFGAGFRMKRELRAHGYSNLVTSFIGGLPNYFAYTNSVLFLKGGSV